MPPQQPDRLLDVLDDLLDFRAHGSSNGSRRDSSAPASGCSDCAAPTQWPQPRMA
jgi:hypothetical protein